MLLAAAALSGFAVLAGTANASRVHEQLGEIGAWAVPSNSHQKPQLLQHTSVGEKLGEIGAWAVPSLSRQKPQTPLATHPTIPNVDPSTFEGYRR
jgi:hypothetical protein